MANSKLENMYWELGETMTNHLTKIYNAYKGNEDVEGYKRLEGLIDNGEISYQQMKRIKNFFDNFSGKKNDTSYLLNGGSNMRIWVEECLSNAREGVKGKKKSMMNIGMHNQFHKDGGVKDSDSSGKRVKNIKLESSSRNISNNRGIYEIEEFSKLLNIFENNNKNIKNI
jgi:hypothetical protein